MKVRVSRHGYFLMIGLTLAASGCGRQAGIERVLVSGSVSFKGQPLGKGQIRFIPTENTPGPMTIEPIEAGEYSTSKTGGVPVGTHRVEILGYDPEVYANAPRGPGSPPIPQLLPRKYNRASELTAKLEPGKDSETLDFNLTP
jgi:hypothetical protein